MAIHYVEQDGSEPSTQGSHTPEPTVQEDDAHEHTASETSDPESSSSDPSTPEQTAEPAKPKYSPRADRLNQKPTKGNAQGLFLPSCCVFVGNLSVRMSMQRLEDDLTALISVFGRCHVKIKIANDRKLPVGFVQFEDLKSATSALKQNGQLVLHNRVLRLELSNCKRTAFFGHISDSPVTRDEVLSVLKVHGALENITIKPFVHWEGFRSTFGIVTFAYPDDYADALQYFQNNRRYYLIRANMDKDGQLPQEGQLPQDYPAPGHRPSNQPPPARGNQQRYNGRRGYHRPWYSGSNSSRGGFRNGPGGPPRQNPSFSSNNQNPPFNNQGNPPHGSFSQNYPGNNFPQGYNNQFNQGYPNPMFNQTYPNNFPQTLQGNNFQPGYPNPSFVAPGAFPNPMVFNQIPMADGPPPPYPTEYTAMPNPGFPIYQPFQPPNPLPPIVTQAQAVPPPVTHRRRLPPRPDCPLIVSSQPQFDTEEHLRLYYEPYPANEVFQGMQPAWVGYPGGDYMQQGYTQPYSPGAGDYRSRHSSMESHQNPNSPPRVGASETTLTQTKIVSDGTERGRQLTRPCHANTDGASDMAPVADPTQTQTDPVSTQASSGLKEEVQTTDAAELTETQIEPAAPVDDSQSQKHQNEPENEPNELQTTLICTAPPEQKDENSNEEAKQPLQIDPKHEESTGSSSEAGPKTPDTDESRERASLQTPAPAESSKPAETEAIDTAVTIKPMEKETPLKGSPEAPATPSTSSTLKPIEKDTPDKAKGKAPTTPTPTKTGTQRLEPAVPDDKHLLARHTFQHRKPLKKKYQPKTATGKTVEQYTREINSQRAADDPDSRVPEHLLQEVIQELENERRENARKSRGLGPSDKSSTASGASKK
ncbi:hypothetical protein N7457_006149 [Penicillium paradoxum]|uniref:uncharacterized protein n=1 Tax=Penicillium paradoxum TaxID=176176 RepID=UPI002549346A|nr:uncharacterized protein N7457_006149 [Penicillium paradoxum]KAJ5780989.1 hypothetical protein N7457_006149 [Penicillium paradoxum]